MIPAEARPQESGAFVHLSYVRSQPPPGVNTDPGNYLSAGLTLRGVSRHAYAVARARAGLDLRADSPDWGELSALGAVELTVAGRLALGIAASGFLLGYSGATEYVAGAGMVQPSFRLGAGRFGFMGQGRGWLGRTSVLTAEGGGFPFGGVPAVRVATDLELAEASFDAWVLASEQVSGGLGSDLTWTDSTNHAAARAWVSVRPLSRGELTGSVLVRRGGGETETGFLGMASYDVDPRVRVELTVTRTLTDLLLGSPQTVAAAFTLQLKVAGPPTGPTGRALDPERPIAEVSNDDPASGVRRVRFALTVKADSVALVGDFTSWEPTQMRRAGRQGWVLERRIRPGVYRFAFLVDGAWHVPEGQPGAVDDGFGQKNLILVVPESD